MVIIAAYFISPEGKIIYTRDSHAREIVRNPEKYGIDMTIVEFIYQTYGEKYTDSNKSSGKAREQILLSLFNRGWMQVRRYEYFWTIKLNKITYQNKKYIHDWAKKTLAGDLYFKEFNPDHPVEVSQTNSVILSSTVGMMAETESFILDDKHYNTMIIKKNSRLYNVYNQHEVRRTKRKIKNQKYEGEQIEFPYVLEDSTIIKVRKELSEYYELNKKYFKYVDIQDNRPTENSIYLYYNIDKDKYNKMVKFQIWPEWGKKE